MLLSNLKPQDSKRDYRQLLTRGGLLSSVSSANIMGLVPQEVSQDRGCMRVHLGMCVPACQAYDLVVLTLTCTIASTDLPSMLGKLFYMFPPRSVNICGNHIHR